MPVTCTFSWPVEPSASVTLAFNPDGARLSFLAPEDVAPVAHLTVTLPADVEIESLAAWLMDKGAVFWAPIPGDDNSAWDQLHRQGMVDAALTAGEIARVEPDSQFLLLVRGLRSLVSPNPLTEEGLAAALAIEEEHGRFYNPNFIRLLMAPLLAPLLAPLRATEEPNDA